LIWGQQPLLHLEPATSVHPEPIISTVDLEPTTLRGCGDSMEVDDSDTPMEIINLEMDEEKNKTTSQGETQKTSKIMGKFPPSKAI
jgi:hypothetical protein